jgi:hypothetical protein
VPHRGRTKLLTIGNVVFKRNDERRTTIHANDPKFSTEAQFVSVTFENQKNGHKQETRTQTRTADPILCPILLWGRIIRRVLHYYPDAPASTPVNAWFRNPDPPKPAPSTSATNEKPRKPSKKAAKKAAQPPARPKPRFIRQEDTIQLLRSTCTSGGGRGAYGYTADEIGTHSIRSGAAMALFLASESVLKIMILGRWSSAAFLRYIRPQVMEWTAGMSVKMLTTLDFRNFHADEPADEEAVPSAFAEQPLQCNVEAALENPEETLFNGSVSDATFPNLVSTLVF